MLPAEVMNSFTPEQRLRYMQMSPDEQAAIDQRYRVAQAAQAQKQQQQTQSRGSDPLTTVGTAMGANYLLNGGSQAAAAAPEVMSVTRLPGGASDFFGISPSTTAPAAAPEITGFNRITGAAPASNAEVAGAGLQSAGQLFSAYNAYRQGDDLGAGIHGAYGTALGSQALASAGYTGVGAETSAAAIPYLAPAAALYGAYQTDKIAGSMPNGGRRNTMTTATGAAAGAAAGSVVPVIGTGLGALIGGAAGFAMGHFGSSKDKYQMTRDSVRDELVKKGFFRQDDTGHQYGTLADGTEFDFSKDGEVYGKPQFDNPLYGKAAAYGNVIASGLGLYGRNREAVATMFANAAVSNAGADEKAMIANFQHFAQKMGLTQQDVQAVYDKLLADKSITQDEYNVFSGDKNIFIPQGQSAAASTGGGGGNIGSSYAAASKAARDQAAAQAQQARKDAIMQNKRNTAYGLIDKVSAMAATPIQYPYAQRKSVTENFSGTLNKIIGG